MNTNPRYRLRPMVTNTGSSQHMAHLATTDGETWIWVSLCGVQCNPGRTTALLRKGREHTRMPDCTHCAQALRHSRMFGLSDPARRLLTALRGR